MKYISIEKAKLKLREISLVLGTEALQSEGQLFRENSLKAIEMILHGPLQIYQLVEPFLQYSSLRLKII